MHLNAYVVGFTFVPFARLTVALLIHFHSPRRLSGLLPNLPQENLVLCYPPIDINRLLTYLFRWKVGTWLKGLEEPAKETGILSTL